MHKAEIKAKRCTCGNSPGIVVEYDVDQKDIHAPKFEMRSQCYKIECNECNKSGPWSPNWDTAVFNWNNMLRKERKI